MTEQDWADYFHHVLPELPERMTKEVAEALTIYRARCQCDLGRWMAAREHEAMIRSRA
jgi:hypothetical protein